MNERILINELDIFPRYDANGDVERVDISIAVQKSATLSDGATLTSEPHRSAVTLVDSDAADVLKALNKVLGKIEGMPNMKRVR